MVAPRRLAAAAAVREHRFQVTVRGGAAMQRTGVVDAFEAGHEIARTAGGDQLSGVPEPTSGDRQSARSRSPRDCRGEADRWLYRSGPAQNSRIVAQRGASLYARRFCGRPALTGRGAGASPIGAYALETNDMRFASAEHAQWAISSSPICVATFDTLWGGEERRR